MTLKTTFHLILLTTLLLTGWCAAEEPDYSLYEKALQKHVREGSVNYAGLAKDNNFKTFMTALHKFDRSKLQGKDEEKAFYINLYNALTLELIVQNLPLESIKDIGRPWSKKLYQNGGEKLTLDHIEHKILRKMGDYRIHFAINCASIGCPDLRPEAYVGDKLNSQLAQQMKLFLSNQDKGVKVDQSGVAQVSKIFYWFRKDFGGKDGVLNILQQRHPQGSKIKKLKFTSYNWDLNKQ